MADQHEASKRVVINALVLVFSRSKISKLVGTDALRTVMVAEYRQHVRDGEFNFEPLWELLEAQPGFDPQLATAPLCRFKTWEKLLGLQVQLPAALRNLTDVEIREAAMECDVPAKELQSLLRSQTEPPPDDITLPGGAKAASRASARANRPSPLPDGAAAKSTSSANGKRRLLFQIGAGLIALLAFGFTGARLYQGCNPSAEFTAVSAATIGQEIPVARAEKLGTQFSVRLSDEGWLSKPEAERRAALESVFTRLRRDGATALLVYDKAGKLRASAQPLTATSLSVKFY